MRAKFAIGIETRYHFRFTADRRNNLLDISARRDKRSKINLLTKRALILRRECDGLIVLIIDTSLLWPNLRSIAKERNARVNFVDVS